MKKCTRIVFVSRKEQGIGLVAKDWDCDGMAVVPSRDRIVAKF